MHGMRIQSLCAAPSFGHPNPPHSAAKKWGSIRIVSAEWVRRSLQQGWPADEAQWPVREGIADAPAAW